MVGGKQSHTFSHLPRVTDIPSAESRCRSVKQNFGVRSICWSASSNDSTNSLRASGVVRRPSAMIGSLKPTRHMGLESFGS